MNLCVVVASANPVKVSAVQKGFARWLGSESFEVLPVSTPSGVSAQPFSSEETFLGAANRMEAARKLVPDANYWTAIEGGVENLHGQLAAYAWVVISSPHQMGKARTGSFFLPDSISQLVRQGIELGSADDMVFSRTNSKQGNGAIGILTNDLVTRTDLYEHAVLLALAPFITPDYYSNLPAPETE